MTTMPSRTIPVTVAPEARCRVGRQWTKMGRASRVRTKMKTLAGQRQREAPTSAKKEAQEWSQVACQRRALYIGSGLAISCI